MPIDPIKVYGKVNGAGDYAQCFPNGMRSAGSAHDTLSANEAVVKIGSAKLGNYNYTTDTIGGYLRFNTTAGLVPRPKAGSNYTFSKQINSYGYINNGIPITGNTINNSIALYGYQLYVRNDSYSSTTAFKTAMLEANVTIDYELATPITYTDLIYSEDGGVTGTPLTAFKYKVDKYSTEEVLVPSGTVPTSTCINADIDYQYQGE